MQNSILSMQSIIKRELTKIYKEAFGKGPETTEVMIYDKFVLIKFTGAFSQIEESLMNSEDGKQLVKKISDDLILKQTSLYVPVVEKTVCEKIYDVSYMMQEENRIVYVFMLFQNKIEAQLKGS